MFVVEDKLSDIEQRMLDAIEREWDRWSDTDAPLPSALVQLLRVAHEALLKRANRMAGEDGLIAQDPEAALLRIERLRLNCLKRIKQMQDGVS